MYTGIKYPIIICRAYTKWILLCSLHTNSANTAAFFIFLFLCQGDEILAVNNVEVKGKSAFEVSSLLQGPNGTSVTIQVLDSNSKLVWYLL